MTKIKTLSFLATLFIIAGIVITLENYQIITGISKLWPLFLTLAGVGFIFLFFQEKRKDPALIWLGSFLTFLSMFFFYLNYSSWKKLAYLWTVFLGVGGLSFLFSSILTKKRILLYLSIFFIFLFLALYLVFTISLRLWPLSLVVFGISLLIIDLFSKKRGKNE